VRLLDLFCGAGGCSAGYQRAGFYVVGVDINPQPNYCGDEFVQADALAYLHGCPRPGFDAIHASPPCQAHTSMKAMWNAREHPDLIADTRELLIRSGLPYVIENVPGAPLVDPVTICGTALGLGSGEHELRRHRIFETNWSLLAPPCAHGGRPRTIGVYGDHARDRRRDMSRANVEAGTRIEPAVALRKAREAMGMPWASWRGLSQAVPPAYTELIGHQLMRRIEYGQAAA
jgi:DNA (cytosine-5)-methyltransferase 1